MNGPSEHLKWSEIACHDGTNYPECWRISRAIPLGAAFEWIRERCGFPLYVSSGYRTESYNRKINDGQGGAKNSQHVQGRALDLHPLKGSFERLKAVAREAQSQGIITGLGYYFDFVHIDIRPGNKATWYGSRGVTENIAP